MSFAPTSVTAPARVDLQLIAESIPHILWMADPAGSTEYINRRGRDYTGRPAGAIRGWDWLSSVHPDDAERARRSWIDARRAQSALELECRIRRADGDFRWHSVHSFPLHAGDGEIVNWIGTATDVNDQRLLEDRLRRAADESVALEALQSTAPLGLGFVDCRSRWVRVNEALASINGAPVEEHLGRTVGELMPTVRPRAARLCRRVLETGRPLLDQEIVAGSGGGSGGGSAWLISLYPVEVDGELIGVGMVVVDVTAQRRQADELRSAVMANIVEGLFTSDSEGRFTFLNAAAERMLGWSGQELHGKPVRDTINFEHRTEGRAVRLTEGAFTRKDGSILPVSYSATPLAAGSGSRGLVVVFRDTSEEKAEREHFERRLDALTWVGRTRDALDEGRLILYSQPIVPLAGGDPSEELLLRMVGRAGEVIRPATFLPAAEKYGLIGEIDKQVVTQAARLAASGRRVQANLSARSVSSPDLLPLIEHALSDAGARPSDLVLEITETALMEDVEAGRAFARGVTEIGCNLALDDFGTGYGSLTRLKRLPIKYLKIDIEFVRDLASSAGSRHVIEAIIALAKGFGSQTIAEGVEDSETLALLGDSGVDFAQGYHLGRPAPLVLAENGNGAA
jgi:PAS domain S-box-containing protein